MRPTVFLGHTAEDGSGWSDRDRELAQSLDLFEGTLCGGCGHSTLETGDPDREGWYDAEPMICAGCQAIQKAQADADPEPGVRWAARLNPAYTPRKPPIPAT